MYKYYDKHVKTENKGMCCGIYLVLINGKLAKNATKDPVLYFFWYYNKKTHHLYSCARIGMSMSTQVKKDYTRTGK